MTRELEKKEKKKKRLQEKQVEKYHIFGWPQ